MKKSRRIFSFLAVALSAVLLFASAGALNSAKQVALAETNPYGKVVTKDSLTTGDYLEYGEYPQTQIKDTNHSNKIRSLISAQFYGSSNAVVSNKTVSQIMTYRTKNNGTGTGSNKYFTYDSTTGYFVANQDIMYGSDTILSKGDKIMEYISGVDAANKYPVYMLNSSGTALSYSSAPTNTSVRSATARGYIDGIANGTTYYYNASTSKWTECDCIYCNGACNIGDGTVYTNTSSNEALSSTSHNWSTSWYDSSDCYTLYESQTSKNLNYYVGIIGFGYYTGPSDDSAFYNNYYKYTNYFVNSSTKSFCYRNGKPLSNVGYDTGKFTYMNSGDLYNHAVWLYSKAILLTKSKCGKDLANNQIYKIEIIPSITEYRPIGYHSYTCSYTIKVWATTNTNTCPYCSEKHNLGKSANVKSFTSPSSTSNSQYILGQNTVATTNGYAAGTQYYFKVEPIKWKVVGSDSNGYTLQSDIVLDSMYYNLYSNSGSNFQTSYLRNWLNRDGSDSFNEKYNILDLRKNSYGAFNEITCNVGRYGSGNSYYDSYANNYKNSSSINGYFSSGLNRYIKGVKGITSNYASYATQETSYSGNTKTTTPSFFQMAFSNVDTGMMQAVGESDHYGSMNFSTSKITKTGSNLVTIPYSASKVVSDGEGFSLNSTSVCSDYAKATGLVCSYSTTESVFNYDNDFGTRYTNNGAVNNGLIWVEDGYNSFTGITAVYSSDGSRVLQQKKVAWFNNKGEVSSNDADNYDQINQSAGVVPIIKLNLSDSSNTVLVKKGVANTGAKYQVEKDTDTGVTYKIMTLNTSAKTTDIQVTGYSSINKNDNAITVALKYDSNYKFDYVKFVITSKTPGSTYLDGAIEGNLYGQNQVYSYTITTTTRKQKLKPIVTTTKTTYTHQCTIVDYNAINNIEVDGNGNREVTVQFNELYGDFEIRAYAVTDNETKMAEISGDEIRTLKYQVSRYSIEDGEYKINSPNKVETTLYEGQTTTVKLEEGYGYYSSVTIDGGEPKYTDEVLGVGTHKLSAHRVTDAKGNVSLKLSAESDMSSQDNLLTRINEVDGIPTFYSNYSGESFNAGIVHSGDDGARKMVDDVIYITDANGGNRNNLSDFTSKGEVTFSEIKAISGLDLSFRVYIKNAYIKNFSSIDELINGKKVTTTKDSKEETITYNFFKVSVIDDNNEEIIDTSETTQTGAGPLTYTSGSVTLTISALASKTFSNGTEYEKYFTVTVSGLTVNGSNPTRVKLITLDGFSSIQQDTYSLSGNVKDAKDTTEDDTKSKKMVYTAGIRSSEVNDTSKGLGLDDNSIARGETLQADFKLNVGYELYTTTDSAGNLKYTSPSITLRYATQVADANGYRLAEKATYPTTGDYAENGLGGKNIKLDEDGNRLDFDEQGNLKYYLKITNTIGTSSDDANPLNYLNGAYYYKDDESGVRFIAPVVTVKELSMLDGVTKYITFKPTIQVSNDNGNTWVEPNNFEDFPSDFKNVRVIYNPEETAYSSYGLSATGKNDLWNINTNINTNNGVTCSAGMSRNQNNIMTYAGSNNKDYYFSITAEYLATYYANNKTVFGSNLINNSYTGYNYEATVIIGTNSQTQKIIASDGSENYEPWVIYASSTLSGSYNATAENNYETFTLSTGYSSSAWNNRSKQFFVIYPDGSVQEMKKAEGSNYPYVTIQTTGETLYAVLDSNDGMFKLHKKTTNGDTIDGDSADGYSNYKVVCIDPVTVDVFVVNGKTEGVEKLAQIGTSGDDAICYSAGETVFRLRVDSVVSDIKFDINDSTVQDYQYKINFQTNFMGETTSPITLSDSWNITAKNSGGINTGMINTDVIKTIGTAENGQMTIQYYDQIVSNNSNGATTHNYYFLAPIDQVVASCLNEVSKASNDSDSTIKITRAQNSGGTTYTYYVEQNNGTKTPLDKGSNSSYDGKSFITYSANGNNYHFTTDAIYQFAGWKVTSTVGLDDSIKGTLSETLSNTQIESIHWKFTNTNTSVTFQAVYEECEVNVEFYSWNMSEDGSGIYNVIKAIYDHDSVLPGYGTEGYNESSFYDKSFKDHYQKIGNDDSAIYTLKGIKYASTISDGDDAFAPIATYIKDLSQFAGNSAASYGTSKGWFVKSNNAEYDVLRTLEASTFSDIGNLSQIKSYIITNNYVEVTLWDGKVMYANGDRTKYFSIAQNGSNFICEYYSKFTLGATTLTNNTQLYEVYEIGNKAVNVTGFEDSNASKYTNTYSVINNYYSNEVKTAGDLDITISLTDAYSKSIKNVENFIKSLTITTTSKYSVGGVYKIEFTNTYNGADWDSTARKYVFRKVTVDGETEEYGYIEFNENYTAITIYIKGVIADVTITTNYTFDRNSYEITIDSSSTVDGQGNSISYGTFYIAYYQVTGDTEETMTQVEVTAPINFSATETIEIKNGEEIIASYTISGGQAIITVYYEYELYIKFVSHVAYSQYFENNVLWQAKVNGEAVNFVRKASFDSTSENYLQYVYDSTNSTTSERAWYYGLMSIKNDYALTYDENIYINKYEVKSTSENNNYYSISLDNGSNDGRDYAKYNENVDVVIAIKDAYTQFTPVVNANINGKQYLIVFAHLYDMAQENGTYKTIKIDNNNVTTVTYYIANGGYYEYAASNGSRKFRVYATAEVDGTYAGYYKVVEVSGDSTNEVETIVTYIKYDFKGGFVKETVEEVETDTKVYDNLSYNYIIANLNTVNNFTYNVYGYKNETLWKSDNKNTYEINVDDLSNNHKTYYTVTDGNNLSLSSYESDGESNPLANVTHGTQIVIKVAMNSAYTQTIPKFKITVGGKTYTVNCESNTILKGVDGEFAIDNKVDHSDNSRTYTFLIAGLEVEIKQEFVYDSVITATSLSSLRSELKLNYVGDGNDNKMYASATYTITVTATDSFTIEDVTETYSPNKYYVVFNRQVDKVDMGVIEYVHESIDSNTHMYYQIVNNNATAQNPFTDNVIAPHDPSRSLTLGLSNFKSEVLEGYSYTGSESTPWITNLTTNESFSFLDTQITKHYILYAPYTEEKYTVVVNGSAVENATTNGTWSTTNNHYGKLTTENINDANAGVSGIQVKYTDTGKMKVSYQLFHAYDHSSIKFSISQYGELKYNESSYVSGTSITINVSKVEETNKTTYKYTNVAGELLATVTITTNNESSLGGLSTTYTLDVKKKIDAGNTAVGNTTGDKIDGKIEIAVDFVKGSEDVTNQENDLNIYKVYIHQGQFNTDTVQDVMTNASYTWHTYKTYNDAENLNETSGINYITVTHNGTVKADAVKAKVDPIAYDGYTFNGWGNGNASQWLIDAKSGIFDEIHLYELYALNSANEITAYNSTGTLNDTGVNNPIYEVKDVTTSTNNANAIFKNVTVTNGKTNVQYTDEFVVKYTLKDSCSNSNNSNLKFTVNNATITSCVYDENTFTYTLTLKYFRGDSSHKVQLNETTVSVNTYEVDFKYYYDYSSNYSETDGWTQSININKYEFAGASLSGNYVHGSDASGKQASIPEIGTIPSLKNGLQGFSNRNNAWMYISRLGSNTNIDDNDIKEAILKVLNMGDCLSDDAINVTVGDVTYSVGLFVKGTVNDDDGTKILGRMVIVPYFVRNEIEVTFNELIEGSSDFSMIKDEEFMGTVSDDASYYSTTYVPYGMPLDKDLLSGYHYINDSNDSSAIEYWSEVVSQFADAKNEHFVFNTFRIIGSEFTNLSTYIVKSSITINIDYNRREYEVVVYKNALTSEKLGTFSVKYGQEFGNTYEIDYWDYGSNTVEEFIKKNITAGQGKHISGWRDFYYSAEDNPIMIITENRGFYPNIDIDEYNVYLNITNPDLGTNLTRYDIYYSNYDSVSNANGYYEVSSDKDVIIEYFYTIGYEKEPIITVSVDGEISNNALEISLNNETPGEWKLTIVFNTTILKHQSVIDIDIEEQISTYEITWPELNSTISTSSGLTYRFVEYSSSDSDKLGYGYRKVETNGSMAEGYAVIFYIENGKEIVDYNGSLTVFVWVAERYLRSSTIKFTVSAGANSRVVTLENLKELGDSGIGGKQFVCTLNNITDDIEIAIDGDVTEIIPSQYEITYHYYFGGGVNGWEEKADKNSVKVTVQASDSQADTYDIVGGSAPSAPTNVESSYNSQYGLYNGGGKWYVSKNGLINFNADINYENIEDYFDEFNYKTYNYTDNINVYVFYIIKTNTVNAENVNADKGNLQLPSIGGNYISDHKSEYKFSYEIKDQYSQNTPVVSIKIGDKTYDLITLKDITSGTIKKSSTESYVVTLTADGYKYVLSTNTLGAVDGNTYYVTVANGEYTISYGATGIATVKLENNKQIIKLASVDGNLSIDVNDEMFELNSYKITFKHGDGSVDELTVKYGNKLTDIPTDDKSFIQKLVYIVTYSDGTTKQLSGKGLAKMEISDNLIIEIEVEINLVILIPLVVGAVVVVVAIVVGITKVTRNRSDRHSSGRSNMEAFDRLRQDRTSNSNDASKKSDRPYNPYIDNSKDRKQ